MLNEVDPAPDDWVEYPNEGFLTVRRMFFNNFPNFGNNCLIVLFGRSDEEFVFVPFDIASQEVEPVGNVSDDCFLFR